MAAFAAPIFRADILDRCIADSGLTVVSRAAQEDLWERVLGEAAYVPFNYLQQTIDFQLEVQRDNGLTDASLILLHDNKACAVWPISIRIQNGRATAMAGFGAWLQSPVFISGLPTVTVKKIIKQCVTFVQSFCAANEISTCIAEQGFVNEQGISVWQYELVRAGAATTVRYDLFVDLHQDLARIKGAFRSSYKSLISQGMKTWSVQIHNEADQNLWTEFMQLHQQVSGRKTRSDKSWDIHLRAMQQNRAFLVCLRDGEKRMVGAGFFIHSAQECFYGVAAYDRSLFEKPLGHVVQMEAIKEMKKRNLQWYKVGTRAFATDDPAPTEKEISITVFKEGFANTVLPRYILNWPIGRGEK
ncbi:MAG: FemAB family protein [Chitinophagaceae bacterium]|nr:FemAB family protein [Chitinophagaceae bacterium]